MPKRAHVAGKKFSKKHTTVTESSSQVIKALQKMPDVKRIAPGEIKQSQKRGGQKFLTLVHTNAGIEMIVTGNSVQKVTVFTEDSERVAKELQNNSGLKNFSITERVKKPGI